MTEFTPSRAFGEFETLASETALKTPSFNVGLPKKQGLYDPRNEHDACGVGFTCHMKGVKSHQIVRDGLFMLENLTHRGAVGADPLMGDGAGILVQIPDRFFREELATQGIDLPPAGEYAVGYFFMPREEAARAHIKSIIAEVVAPKARCCSAIAKCRSITHRFPRRLTSPRPSRSTCRFSSAQALVLPTMPSSNAGCSPFAK
jgi:glutamate synthase (NADPH/NADH) large chain